MNGDNMGPFGDGRRAQPDPWDLNPPVGGELGDLHAVSTSAGKQPRPRRWVIDQLVPVGAATTLFGDGGLGKTLIAMQMGVAVERGGSIFGHQCTPSPILGIFCEDDREELERRFHAICRSAHVDQADVEGFLYQSRFGKQSILGAFDAIGSYTPSRLRREIVARAKDTGAKMVIFDNVLHLYSGNINDPGAVTRFMADINEVALEIDGAALLLGHIAKQAGSQFSGTAAWSNASRSRLFLGRPGDLPGGGDASGDPDERIFARAKANYAGVSSPIALRWHEGAFVRPQDVDGDAAGEMRANAQANHDNDAFLACLRLRNSQERPVSQTPCPNYAVTQFADMPQAKGIGKRRLKAAMDRLFKIGAVEVGFVCRDKGKARDKFGLRETPN